MFGPELEYPILVAACCVAGFLVHALKKIIEAGAGKESGRAIWRYLVDYPTQTIVMLLTTAGLTMGLWSIDQLNGLTGFFVGYLGNSAADLVGARVIGQVKTEPKDKP